MTKQTRAEELWEKIVFIDSYGSPCVISKDDFIAALLTYGQEVRKRDAEVCREVVRAGRCNQGLDCVAAIEKGQECES